MLKTPVIQSALQHFGHVCDAAKALRGPQGPEEGAKPAETTGAAHSERRSFSFRLAAVDATAEESLGGQYGVQGFPTIKVFGASKSSPTDYQGPRQADGIIQAALQEVGAFAVWGGWVGR